MMRVSQSGSDAIRAQEGFSATAYPDPGTGGEPWTIGFGTTRYLDGEPVKPGDRITMAQASELFAESLRRYEDGVNRLVRVPINQQQFDALVSLAYNIGVGALEDSTLLRKLNSHDYAGAADEFLRWNRAGGRVMEGLRRRRERERALFLGGANALETPVAAVKPSPAADKPEISPLSAKPMAPVVAALLPSLINLLPELGKLFGSGSAVSDRNIAAAQKVAETVVQAVGAPNLQGAVETMSGDPEARRKASEAVQGIWYELVEVGGGIAAARTFNVQTASIPAWRMPAVWVSGALLALVFMVVGSVLWGNGWSNDIRLQVVTAVLTIIGMVGSFWLGTSASSQRKTDLLAEK